MNIFAKIFTFFSMLCFSKYALGNQWQEIFKQKDFLLQDDSGRKIIEQYNAFITNKAPKIADPVIKQIEITENNETLIDVRNMKNQRIQMLADNPERIPFASPNYNSGLPSACKIRLSVWQKLEKTLEYLDELSEYFGYKAGTIEIKVFEGLRDLATQEQLFKNKFDEIKAKNPTLDENAAYAETSKWVSPIKNNVPVHSTGAAIDIRLWDTQLQNFIDMGLFGVIWGTNEGAVTFSENITPSQKMNRLFLLLATTKGGLTNYIYEYWHFSFGDRYAAYWNEKNESKRKAIYDSMQ